MKGNMDIPNPNSVFSYEQEGKGGCGWLERNAVKLYQAVNI